MPELHDHILSLDCYTARLMLSLCGSKCARRTVEFVPGLTSPVYVDGPVTVNGAMPILRYLAARHEPVRWRADDADVARWLAFAEGPLSAVVRARDVRMFGAGGEPDALAKEARAALRSVENYLTDQHLRGEDWLAGVTVTLADVAVFAPVALGHDAGIGPEDFPAINLWQRQVRGLKRFISMPGIPDYF